MDPPRSRPAADTSDIRVALGALLEYCRLCDWAGYDPYDALNSPFARLPLLDRRFPRIALTQILKRSLLNVRPLLLIPKTHNPKALGLFLSAIVRMPHLGSQQAGLVGSLTDRLIALRSPGHQHWCWGYSFPWQTRTVIVPRGTPNLVCTVFVANALLDAFERNGDSRYLAMAVSAADYVHTDLYWTGTGKTVGFAYPLPNIRAIVHNANLLAAAFLCRVARASGDATLIAPALRVAMYSAGRQRRDGSWPYGEADTQGWIDNFHTGYNLCALKDIDRLLGQSEFEAVIQKGFEFYRAHFFSATGAPRYFHDRTYPIDAHCVAQSIITLVALQNIDQRNLPLARHVLGWALEHMWDPKGFFYYRVLRFLTVRTSYMRWTQAWMLLALSMLANESDAVPVFQET